MLSMVSKNALVALQNLNINESLSIFAKLDSEIQPLLIRDSLHLGKYKKESVKLNRLMDVTFI